MINFTYRKSIEFLNLDCNELTKFCISSNSLTVLSISKNLKLITDDNQVDYFNSELQSLRILSAKFNNISKLCGNLLNVEKIRLDFNKIGSTKHFNKYKYPFLKVLSLEHQNTSTLTVCDTIEVHELKLQGIQQ